MFSGYTQKSALGSPRALLDFASPPSLSVLLGRQPKGRTDKLKVQSPEEVQTARAKGTRLAGEVLSHMQQ